MRGDSCKAGVFWHTQATARPPHLFKRFEATDVFVSMVSSHVTRGPRNLASNTIHLLRHVGINSFPTVLLPAIEPDRSLKLIEQPAIVVSR